MNLIDKKVLRGDKREAGIYSIKGKKQVWSKRETEYVAKIV